MGYSRPLFSVFSSFQYKHWLDLKLRPLVSEATALPTEPQPLPNFGLFLFFLVSFFHRILMLLSRWVELSGIQIVDLVRRWPPPPHRDPLFVLPLIFDLIKTDKLNVENRYIQFIKTHDLKHWNEFKQINFFHGCLLNLGT